MLFGLGLLPGSLRTPALLSDLRHRLCPWLACAKAAPGERLALATRARSLAGALLVAVLVDFGARAPAPGLRRRQQRGVVELSLQQSERSVGRARSIFGCWRPFTFSLRALSSAPTSAAGFGARAPILFLLSERALSLFPLGGVARAECIAFKSHRHAADTPRACTIC